MRFDTPPDNAKRMIKNCHAERVEARYMHEHAWCALVRQRFGRLSVTAVDSVLALRRAQRDSGGECGSRFGPSFFRTCSLSVVVGEGMFRSTVLVHCL